MDNWKSKREAIKAMLGDKCLFCEKNGLSEEYLKARDYYISLNGGSYEDYDQEAGIVGKILLCEKCQKRYDLLKEIENSEDESEKE